jgi:hypothetical protein
MNEQVTPQVLDAMQKQKAMNQFTPQQQQVFNDLIKSVNDLVNQTQQQIMKAVPAPPQAQQAQQAQGQENIPYAQSVDPSWKDTWKQKGVGGVLGRAWGGLQQAYPQWYNNNLDLSCILYLQDKMNEEIDFLVDNNLLFEMPGQIAGAPQQQAQQNPFSNIINSFKQKLSMLIQQAFVKMKNAESQNQGQNQVQNQNQSAKQPQVAEHKGLKRYSEWKLGD